MLPIELSSNEYLLYGIKENEVGFTLKKEDVKIENTVTKLTNYPSTPPFELSTSSIIDKHSLLDSTSLSTRLFDSSLDSTNASWSYIRTGSSMLKIY